MPQRSLTVVTGVSGSGKSSLVFDTLYAEGQRRFVQSLSTYTRLFLDETTQADRGCDFRFLERGGPPQEPEIF